MPQPETSRARTESRDKEPPRDRGPLRLNTNPVNNKINLLDSSDRQDAIDAIESVFKAVKDRAYVNAEGHIYFASQDVREWQIQFSVSRYSLIVYDLIRNPHQRGTGAFNGGHISVSDINNKATSQTSKTEIRLVLKTPDLRRFDASIESSEIAAELVRYFCNEPEDIENCDGSSVNSVLIYDLVGTMDALVTSVSLGERRPYIYNQTPNKPASSSEIEKRWLTPHNLSVSGNRGSFYHNLPRSTLAHKAYLSYMDDAVAGHRVLSCYSSAWLNCSQLAHREL